MPSECCPRYRAPTWAIRTFTEAPLLICLVVIGCGTPQSAILPPIWCTLIIFLIQEKEREVAGLPVCRTFNGSQNWKNKTQKQKSKYEPLCDVWIQQCQTSAIKIWMQGDTWQNLQWETELMWSEMTWGQVHLLSLADYSHVLRLWVLKIKQQGVQSLLGNCLKAVLSLRLAWATASKSKAKQS